MPNRDLPDMRADQISKAREIAIGSDLSAMRKKRAVDSIFVWPKSVRTVSISPVPFKMWRAFVRRKDSMPYFLGRGPPRQSSFSADVLLRLSPDRRHPIWLVGSSSDESG
jgi:hypothetical protein